MKEFLLIISFLLITVFSWGQQSAYEGPVIIYSHQYYLGGHISNAGFGISGYSGKYNGFKTINLKGVEILKLKHPKEFKLPSNGGDNSRRFAYGKLNAFQAVRVMFGKKKILTKKLRKGATAVGVKYLYGGNLGLLKPVYVEVNRAGGFGPNSIERYDPEIHDFSIIDGRASFFQGIDEMKFEPGLSGRFSVFFEFSGEKDRVQQLEAGIALDAYSRKVPIMTDEVENKQFFATMFLSYSLGTKFNKR